METVLERYKGLFMHPMEERYIREIKNLIQMIETDKKSAKFFQASAPENAAVVTARKEAEAVIKALNNLIIQENGRLKVKSKQKPKCNQEGELYAIPYVPYISWYEFLELSRLAELCSRVSLAYRFVKETGKPFSSEMFVMVDEQSGTVKTQIYNDAMHQENMAFLSHLPKVLPKPLLRPDLANPYISLSLLSAVSWLMAAVCCLGLAFLPAFFIPALVFASVGGTACMLVFAVDCHQKKPTPLHKAVSNLHMEVGQPEKKPDIQPDAMDAH